MVQINNPQYPSEDLACQRREETFTAGLESYNVRNVVVGRLVSRRSGAVMC